MEDFMKNGIRVLGFGVILLGTAFYLHGAGEAPKKLSGQLFDQFNKLKSAQKTHSLIDFKAAFSQMRELIANKPDLLAKQEKKSGKTLLVSLIKTIYDPYEDNISSVLRADKNYMQQQEINYVEPYLELVLEILKQSNVKSFINEVDSYYNQKALCAALTSWQDFKRWGTQFDSRRYMFEKIIPALISAGAEQKLCSPTEQAILAQVFVQEKESAGKKESIK